MGTFLDLLEKVGDLERKMPRDGSPLWFRGERDPSWELRSRLHRTLLAADASLRSKPARKQEQLLRELGKTYLHKFQAKAWPLLDPFERASKWGVLFSAQHHGLPTRLLDWTESLAAAVYFGSREPNEATRKADLKNKPFVIYVLDPQGLNQKAQGERSLVALSLDDDEHGRLDTWAYHPLSVVNPKAKYVELQPSAVVPTWSNPRMIVQKSSFVLTGDSFEPMDHKSKYQGCIWRFEVDHCEIGTSVAKFLRHAGVNQASLFPDLASLARWIMDSTSEGY